ncbi:MAG: potassium transporter TrkA, partial [Arcobacter sp.]
KVAVRSTTPTHTENLRDLGAQIIVNPFSIISSEINMALLSPNIFKLEKWLYKIDTLSASLHSFPKGIYVICGYGRMGRRIYEKLSKNDIECRLIEIDANREFSLNVDEMSNMIFGDADNKELLSEVGVQEASVIIAATNDDTTNLSILATAKKINPDIITIVRENELEDDLLFQEAKINHIFTPSKILVNKITNSLINPLSDEFIKQILKKDDKWASSLILRLIKEINDNPILLEFKIEEKTTPQIYNFLNKQEQDLSLNILATSLHNCEQKNNIVPLLLQRDSEITLLPLWEQNLKIGDKILLACDAHAKDDIEYICQNENEFYYAFYGEEKMKIFKRKNK